MMNEVIYILNLILGRAGYGKTTYIRRLLKKHIEKEGKKVIFLVPEQKSFDTEKSLLNIVGEKDFKFVNVLSFDRMSEFVFRQVGGINSDKLTDAGRSIFMSMALEKAQSQLKLYKNSFDNIDMVNMMTDTLKEMKSCLISSENTGRACSQLEESILKQKLREITIIMDFYNSFIEKNFLDPLDNLTFVLNKIKSTNILKGYTLFIDEFNDFTVQQINVLEEMICQSENTFITFCTDENYCNQDKASDLFSQVNRTVNMLIKDVKNRSVNIGEPVILKDSVRFKNDDLKYLERSFLVSPKTPFKGETNNIFLYNASDIYDECEFVAMTIRKKVIEENCRYRDFSIIAGNIESYGEKIKNILSKYEISYFMDEPETTAEKTLLCAVFAAFDVIISNFETESVLRYLKTGLVGINTDDISALENYVFLWEISGSKWTEPFVMHPEGFYDVMSDSSCAKLSYLESLRGKILDPLMKFGKKIKDGTGYDISKSVYELLIDINMRENIKEFCGTLINSHDLSKAEEQGRLWDILMDALNQCAVTLGEVKIKPKRYKEILRIVIQSEDMAFIPRGLDEVIISSPGRMGLSECKITFILGAAEGDFPANVSTKGIFSDCERKKLISMGMEIYNTFEGMYERERFLAYKALSSPSDELYISWPSSGVSGDVKLPSEIVREIKSIFKDIKIHDKYYISKEDWLWAEKPAFEMCCRGWNERSELFVALKDYFLRKSDYSYKTESVKRAVNSRSVKFLSPDKAKKLFGTDIKLSASQIEKYCLCAFQYFCKYGLKAKERYKAQFSSLEYGSLIHFILEKVFKIYMGDKITSLDENMIRKDVQTIMSEYVEKHLGGLNNKSSRFKYLFMRCSQASEILLKRLSDEFKQSLFKPVDCELDISNDGDIKPLVFSLLDEGSVYIEGRIDRVDIMNLNGEKFVRVVDYKTGSKKFKLSDVLHGINIQMILYLMAIKRNGKERYGNIIPCGVLYMPAVKPYVIAEDEHDEKKSKAKAYERLKMNGLVLNDTRAVKGMEEDSKGIFIPAVIKNGKICGEESLVDLEQMETIMKYTEKTVREVAENLRMGEIPANPIEWGKDANGEPDGSCRWCPYGAICGVNFENALKVSQKLSKDDVLNEMKKTIEGDNCE